MKICVKISQLLCQVNLAFELSIGTDIVTDMYYLSSYNLIYFKYYDIL